jgi:hypothetical protein
LFLETVHSAEIGVVKTTQHNHVLYVANIEARKVVEKLKENSTKTGASTQDVLAFTTKNVNTAVTAQLPSVPSMKRTVQRTRNRNNAVPPNRKTLEELTIPDEYR